MLWLLNLEFLILILIGVKLMSDFSKVTASVIKLQTDVAALVAQGANDQPQIDAVQQSIDAIDATVLAATTPPAQPTA